MIPHHGWVIRETIFSSVPLATPSSLSWALEGLFELQGPSVSIPVRFRSTEIQGHCWTQVRRSQDTVRSMDTNRDCSFVVNELVFIDPKIGMARAPCPPWGHPEFFWPKSWVFLKRTDGLSCISFRWWCPPVTPETLWPTSSRLARVRLASSASPPSPTLGGSWQLRGWTSGNSRGGNFSLTRWGAKLLLARFFRLEF